MSRSGRLARTPSVPPGFVLKYYLYRATAAVGFTTPVWYLYLEAATGSWTLTSAANAVFWTGLILFEIPTGYVGDRIGRRRALVAGTVVHAVAAASTAFVSSFLEVAVVFVVWAVGSTFRSGTADAWLYEILRERLDESEFARVRGRGGAVSSATMAVTAVLGGYLVTESLDGTGLPPEAVAVLGDYLATGSMADAYLATGAVVALGVPVLASMPDPDGGVADDEQFTVLDAIPILREQFTRPPLRSFVLLVALYSGVHYGVNFYIQPVSLELGLSRVDLGWMFGGFTVVTGAVSYFSGALNEHVGVRRWFTGVPLGLAAAFLAVAAVPVLAVPVFFLMRGLRGAAVPLANQFVNDHTGDVGRATVLSAAGMVYNLVIVPFELGAGALADVLGPVNAIGLFGVALLVGSVALLAAGSPFGTPSDATGDAVATD